MLGSLFRGRVVAILEAVSWCGWAGFAGVGCVASNPAFGSEESGGGEGSGGSTGSATSGMTVDSCGDGLTDPGEECDDGNGDDHDGCRNTCELARCGDGVVWTGQEQCDDGDEDPANACTNECTIFVPECTSGMVLTPVDVVNPLPELGPVCNLEGALEPGGAVAGIDRGLGVTPVDMVDGYQGSGCIAIDFGAVRTIGSFTVSMQSLDDACGQACDPNDATYGCGHGEEFNSFAAEQLGTYTLVAGYVDVTATLTEYVLTFGEPARYLVLCRASYTATGSDLGVDSATATCL